MKIVDVICSSGKTGFFFDDQKAIKTSAVSDGAAYIGEPVTPGFKSVRQAGESVSIMFLLDDGQIAVGDCAAVQYSGAGGRDPLFLAKDYIPIIEREIIPLFKGRDVSSFREMAELADRHVDSATNKPMHTAIRYGVTQTCLDAVAKNNKKLQAQVICDEYGLEMSNKIIPIFSQSGDDRYMNADKMILKAADVMPHALINNISKFGQNGEILADYIKWLSDRITKLKPFGEYNPVLHIDLYGIFTSVFDGELKRTTEFISELEKNAHPYHLRLEGPVDKGGHDEQIEALAELTRAVDEMGIQVEIVADEWCNTLEDIKEFTDKRAGHMVQIKTPDLGGINNSIEAVLYCKKNKMGAYLGGTCNETNISAAACAHIAMATSPVQLLAKPGMGVDEGYMIVYNEMSRILALSGKERC